MEGAFSGGVCVCVCVYEWSLLVLSPLCTAGAQRGRGRGGGGEEGVQTAGLLVGVGEVSRGRYPSCLPPSPAYSPAASPFSAPLPPPPPPTPTPTPIRVVLLPGFLMPKKVLFPDTLTPLSLGGDEVGRGGGQGEDVLLTEAKWCVCVFCDLHPAKEENVQEEHYFGR